MRKIKILYIITLAEIGGAQTHLRSLVENLDRENFEITAVTSSTGPLITKLKLMNIRVIKCVSMGRELNFRSDLKTLKFLYTLCRKEKFDIVHAHSSKAGFLGRVAAYLAGIPVILFSVHGFAFNVENNFWKKKIYILIEYLAGKFSSHVICVSSRDLEHAIEEGILSAKKVQQIANGVNVKNFYSANRKSTRIALCVKDHEILIGTVARLAKAKGQEYLIQAVSSLVNKYPHVKFLLVGSGKEEGFFKKLIHDLDLENHFILTGDREDIPDLLAAIDIFAFPSLSESMPYAVLEAMAAGKPIVASKTGGISELIKNGLEGYLVEPGNISALEEALKVLIEDEPLKVKMGECGRRKVEAHFGLDRTIRKTMGLYRRKLNQIQTRRRKAVPLMLAVGDILCFNVAILSGFAIRFQGNIPAINLREYTYHIVAISVIQILVFYFLNMYEKTEENLYESLTFPQVLKAVSLVFLLLIGFRFFIVAYYDFPRIVLLLSWSLSAIFITGWHSLIGRLFSLPIAWKRVLIVGAGQEEGDVFEAIKTRPYLGYEVVGYVARTSSTTASIEQDSYLPERLPLLGNVEELQDIIKEYHIDHLIMPSPGTDQYKFIQEIVENQDLPLDIDLIPSAYEFKMGKVNHRLVGDYPLISFPGKHNPPIISPLKRVIDLILSFLFIIVLSPLMCIIIVLIKYSYKGPVIYKQKRVGQNRKIFTIYKFRSMIEETEEKEPILAEDDDTRIGSVGKLLCQYHLDELPQLLNILKGEMSFVGPRPECPEFVNKFIKTVPLYKERFTVKPGLTGLAQINSNYDTKPHVKIKYDLLYIYNYSLFRDLVILRDTIKNFTRGKK